MKNVSEILKDLIAIPSVNPMGSNSSDLTICGELEVNEYICDFIKKIGIEPIVHKTVLPGRDNVGGMIYKGEKYRTIILQCHTDTVGINENKSLLVPFEKDGRIYGRGACDCKGGLAAMLVAFADAAMHPEKVKNNIIVMGVSDEEYSFKGSLALCEQFPTKGADFGIVGEPTECFIVNGFKGVARWDISVEGKAFHSSEPEKGISAIYRMAKIVSLIEKYQSELTDSETISIGTVKGGSAVNIVPDSCVIEIDRRLTKKTSPQKALSDIKDYLLANLDFDFTMSGLKDAQNAELIDRNHPGVRIMSGIASEMGLESKPCQVAFGSDAFRMNDAGIPTVLWGPGSIKTAHTSDEYVKIEDLDLAVKFYHGIMTSKGMKCL